MADRHVLLKHSCHEIAHKQGRALTFMAKYNTAKAGNSCHVHCSLWTKDGKESLFRDDNGKLIRFATFKYFLLFICIFQRINLL
jgi:glutamine synthetase